MSRWAPCKRRDFVRRLRELGFDGPFSGGRHQFVTFQEHRLAIPSNEEYSVAQLRVLLSEVKEIIGRQIPLEEWTKL